MSGILPVLNEYGFVVRGIIPIQEDVYRVETSRGVYCLKRANKGEQKMLFIYSVLKHLVEHGFTRVSAPVPAKNGDPLVKFGREIYFITEWVDGIPCDFGRDDHLRAAARTLAEFHLVARGVQVLPGGKTRAMYEKWPQVFSRRIADLRQFKETTGKKKALTDFEKKYLTHVDYFIARGEQAENTLKDSAYEKIVAEAEAQKTFTHRDVAARNFIIGPDRQAYLIDFDYCRYDIRATDVVRMVERTLKNFRWSMAKADLILHEYNGIYPLEPEQYQVLLAFFQFPQKFWRISSRYFNQQRRWQEEGYLKKLAAVTRKMEQQERFVKSFTDKYCDKGGPHGHG